MYFEEVKKDFLVNLDVKDTTRKLYKTNLEYFQQWVVTTGKNITTLARSDVLEYKSSLIRKNLSGNTVESYLKAVRVFYRYAETIGYSDNIAAGIRLVGRNNNHTKVHLNTDEIAKLYAAIQTESLTGKRDYAIVNLMLRSGFRCVEVSRMRVKDITEIDDGYAVNVFRKGSDICTQCVGLTHKAIGPIYDYLSFRGVSSDDDYIFKTHCSIGERRLMPDKIGKIVHKYMVKAGIYSKEKTSHSLRHTAAVTAILKGASTKEVQQMLGHKRIETTEIYLASINKFLSISNPAARRLDDAF